MAKNYTSTHLTPDDHFAVAQHENHSDGSPGAIALSVRNELGLADTHIFIETRAQVEALALVLEAWLRETQPVAAPEPAAPLECIECGRVMAMRPGGGFWCKYVTCEVGRENLSATGATISGPITSF